MQLKPVGRKRESIKIEKPDPVTAEYISSLTLNEAIPYLRAMSKSEEETFPWPLVERFLHEEKEDGEPSPGYNLPQPRTGYEWHYVSSMGGWLEVDKINKKQGRFIMTAMS